MSIHSIHTSPTPYMPPTAASGAVVGASPVGGPIGSITPPGDTTVTRTYTGDGPILTSLKSSMADAGFSQTGSSADKPTYEADMHTFTHAFFQALHDQKAADIADGTAVKGAHGANMQMAIAQLQSQAEAGAAPSDLQTAFDALQQTQPAGSPGSTATLSSVLAAMPVAAPDMTNPVGGVVDTTA